MSESGFVVVDRAEIGGIRLEEVRNAAGFHYPTHGHDEAFVTLTLAGMLQGAWTHEECLRPKGTLTIIPAGALHSMSVPEPSISFQIVIPPANTDQSRAGNPRPSVKAGGLPNWLAYRIYGEFKLRCCTNSTLSIEALLTELTDTVGWRPKVEAAKNQPSWLIQLEDLLRESLAGNPTADELATTIGIAPAHMMRTFRRHKNCTIGAYVRRLRLEQACQILGTREIAIGEVAHLTGFADHSHLNRHFRRHFGVTPSEFQSDHRRLKQSSFPF